jgi:hypothetical protein
MNSTERQSLSAVQGGEAANDRGRRPPVLDEVRVGNLSDGEILNAWQSGNRETMIETVSQKFKSN